MPKKSKVGKQRKDKYYKLAKETGYRSRASFKLLQLNRKFEFLQKSRVLIDLCAAPGGWLQVAQQAMPVSSIIIGVDLVPIKPIANVINLQEDITTEKCRKALKRELKTWKADTVLNDGAPNVGKSWIHDAFMQNHLTLSALKLATEMLVKGGWFVTKVFRSKDYLSLVWAFKKLFKRVHITKPQASRAESAEIFIVCQGYLAPDQIDPKFLDPSYVFKDVPEKGETKTTIDLIARPKKKAEGYDDDAPTYSTLKASEFVFCDNHLDKLGKCSEIILDDEDIRDHKLTTAEIKFCCKDIKVLGKGDLKSLLHWRKQLRETIKGLDDDKKKEKKEQNEEEEIDDAVKQAEDLELAKLQEAKRKKKKILKERKKIHEKINLKMIIKDDDPIIDQDLELFTLAQIKDPKDLTTVEEENNLEIGLEPPKTNTDDLFKGGYRSTFGYYNRESKNIDLGEDDDDVQEEASLYSSDDDLSEELEFESDEEEDEDDATEAAETILKGKQNPLMVDLVDRPDRVKDTIDRWFDKEEFNEEEDNDLELDMLVEKYNKPKEDVECRKKTGLTPGQSKKIKCGPKECGYNSDDENEDDMKERTEVDTKRNQNSLVVNKSDKVIAVIDTKIESDDFFVENEDDNLELDVLVAKYKSPEYVDQAELKESNESKTTNKKSEPKKKKKRVRLDTEGLALGSLLVQSKKMKRDIIEESYNRFASNDENLPVWFVEDEKKHYRKQLPVTKEMIIEYRQRLKEINARPIKKVVEAKARKRRRLMRRMEKAKKRAEKITDHPDMTDKEKAEQLKAIYKKALPKEDHSLTYVVAKKGIGPRVHRPAGVKGRYRVVDKRMRKDDRKEKMMMKKGKPNKNKKRNTNRKMKKGKKGKKTK